MKRMIYLAVLAPMMMIGCSKKQDTTTANKEEISNVKIEVAKS